MSQFRFARLALMLAAIGLNAAPALTHSAFAQDKNDQAAAAQPKPDRKSTRLNSSHSQQSRMPSSA